MVSKRLDPTSAVAVAQLEPQIPNKRRPETQLIHCRTASYGGFIEFLGPILHPDEVIFV